MEALRRIRTMRGMNQVDLAKASGVAQNTISEIELGKREARPGTLKKLADALSVEIADFFPKAQSPLPDIFAGWEQDPEPISERERAQMDREARKALERHEAGESPRAYFVEDILDAAAGGWLQTVADPDTDSGTAWGIVRVARDLENRLSVFLGGPESYDLPGEALGQIARVMKQFEEVQERYGARLEAELSRPDAPADELEVRRQRKEQLDRWKAGKTA